MSRIQNPPRCRNCRHVYIPLPVDRGYCDECDPGTDKVETPRDYANDDERINWMESQ